MLQSFAFAMLAGLLVASTVCAQAPVGVRTDALGDPLPPGAVARLGTLRLHSILAVPRQSEKRSGILTAKYSPDGKKIAMMTYYPTANLRVVDAANVKELTGPWCSSSLKGQVVAWAPDSNSVAVSGTIRQSGIERTQICLWDVAGGKLLQTLPRQGDDDNPVVIETIQDLVFTDQGKTLISAGDQMVRWWDLATGKEKRKWTPFEDNTLPWQGPSKAKSFDNCTLSPGGNFLTVQANREALGFELATGQIRWRTTCKLANLKVAYSADDKLVAVAVEMDKVELRDTATGNLLDSPPLALGDGAVRSVALSSDGSTLAIGRWEVSLWKPAERNKLRQITSRFLDQFSLIGCLAFSPDNKTILSAADSLFQVNDVASLKDVYPWDGHRGAVDTVAFSADGKQLTTGGAYSKMYPQELLSWDTSTWKCLQIRALAIRPWSTFGVGSSDYIHYAGRDGSDRFSLFELRTGKMLGRFCDPANPAQSEQGYFSPSGKYYVLPLTIDKAKSDLRIYAVPSCKLMCQLPDFVSARYTKANQSVVFSSGDELAAFFNSDDTVLVCDTRTGNVRHRLDRLHGGSELATPPFSPDGKLLVSWLREQQRLEVWNVRTGNKQLEIRLDAQYAHDRVNVAWSPDSRTLAVGDQKIQLFEMASGKLRREFEGHDGPVRSLAFSPDGRLLASGSTDTTVLIWDVWGR